MDGNVVEFSWDVVEEILPPTLLVHPGWCSLEDLPVVPTPEKATTLLCLD